MEFDTGILFLGVKKEEADRSADGPYVANQNFLLKTSKVASVFYELGCEILKELRVAIKELRDLKHLIQELLDIEMVILKSIITVLKKMKESASKTEETLACQNEELKCLRKVISDMKQQKEKGLESKLEVPRVEKPEK